MELFRFYKPYKRFSNENANNKVNNDNRSNNPLPK